MSGLDSRSLLELWESGRRRHPLDRALLLAGLSAPGLEADRLADLPLGQVNRRLLQLREALFGGRIASTVRCEHCRETIEIELTIGELLAVAVREETRAIRLEAAGCVFRPPSLRDLADLLGREEEEGAIRLLQLCCVEGDPEKADAAEREALLESVGRALERLDPLADLDLALTCGACGEASSVTLDIARYLWSEIETEARTLLREVDALARAYGWSEAEILALGSSRRRSYLELALA